MIRVGIGYDVHKLAEGEKLVIADVEIPYEKGSVGHSDGDALTHAIIDALLGAACLGDLGEYFPSNEDQWKGISSLDLLAKTRESIVAEGYSIVNIDSVIILQKPRLKKHILQIRENLSKTTEMLLDRISVKATTVDNLGAIGAGDGWASQAVVTITN